MSKNISKNKRVVVAMSGGVDSSVAAYLLKKEGYDVIGIFLKLWQAPCYVGGIKKQNLCCDDKAMAVAGQIANKLKIPFYVLKVDKLFKKEIVDNFISEYEKGRTPNPCVRCNKYIKFGYLWEKTRQLKADYLATGHYINKISNFQFPISNVGVPSAQLVRSKDLVKDQTYFLSSIDSKIVPHLLFPLGDMTKKEVRAIAKKAKLPVYNKKDSMGVCFIPDGDTDSFLKHFSKKSGEPGEIVDKWGNVLGYHQGLLGCTVGQKIGDDQVAAKYIKKTVGADLCVCPKSGEHAGSPLRKSEIPRLYIIAIDSKKNRLIVGENKDCFSTEMIVENLNILDKRFWEMVKNRKTFYAQIRGGHKAEKCTVSVGADLCGRPKSGEHAGSPLRRIKIKFLKPVRAITPGQTVAIYSSKGVLLGGGIIV